MAEFIHLRNLRGKSKEVSPKTLIFKTSTDDLWRKVQTRDHSVVDHMNKTAAQISILSHLPNSDAHKNSLMKVLSDAYVPTYITSKEMDNMVGHVFKSHKITFHKDK